MAQNLSINVTADTAQLRAQLAIAQAQFTAFNAQLRGLATQMAATGAATGAVSPQMLQVAQSAQQAAGQVANFRSQLNTHHQATQASIISLGGLKETLGEVGRLFGVGFGAEKIIESIKSLAEWGEHTRNLASAVGSTPQKYAELGGVFELVGANAENAGRTIQILERNIANARENPTGPQARAFEGLGLGPEALDLGARDPIAFVKGPLADAAQRHLAEGEDKAEAIKNLKNVLGRGAVDFVQALQGGSEKVAELITLWLRLSGVTEETLKHLAETGELIHQAEVAFNPGLKIAIYENFRNPINDSIIAIRDWATNTKDRVKEVKEVLTNIKGVENFLNYTTGGGAAKDFDEWIKAHSGANFWKRLGIGGEGGGTEDVLRAHGADSGSGEIYGPPAPANKTQIVAPETKAASLFNPTDKERAFLNEARRHENASGNPNLLHYPAPGQSSTVNTLDEVEAAKVLKNSHAFGLYGFQPGTYREMAAKTGLYDLSETSQNINALELFREKGPKPWPWATAGSEGGGSAGAAPDYPKIEKDRDETIRAIEAKRKATMEWYAVEIEGARDNQKQIQIIQSQQNEDEKKFAAQKQAAQAKAIAESRGGLIGGPDAVKKLEATGPQTDSEMLRIQKTQLSEQNRAADEAARIQISKLETDRKISDQQAATKLKRVEDERSTGQLSIDAAKQAEEQIIANAKAADDKILADELAAAGESKKIHDDVVNRKAERDAKYREQKQQIDDKADKEHAQQAHAIDAELAGQLSGAIVNLAWGKGGGIGQQIAGFVQSQEKKALDVVGTRLLDASGVGNLLGGIGDKLFSFLPSAASGAAAQSPVVMAIGAQTPLLISGIAGPIVAAISGSAATGAAATIGSKAFGLAGSAIAATFSKAGSPLEAPAFIAKLLAAERGGVIPSAAGGMTVNDGKGGTIAIVHPNEMVLPAPLSLGIQNAISRGNGWSIPTAPSPNSVSPNLAAGGQGGGGDTHITHNWDIDGVLSTHDFQRLLMAHSDTIAKAGASASRNFSPYSR